MNIAFPTDPDGITPELITTVVEETHPETVVTGVEVTERHTYGEGDVSAAARLALTLTYADPDWPLPREVVVKIDRDNNSPYPLYANEVEVYRRLRPERVVEAPRFLGGTWHPETRTLGLLIEDLRPREAVFPRAVDRVGVEHVKAVLDNLAALHATYWESSLLGTELSWLQSHVSGALHDFYTDPDKRPAIIAHQVETVQFKREMVQRLGVTVSDLAAMTDRLHRWQSIRQQTVVHGDAHVGNTYLLPDGRRGLLDWQLTVRGYPMHDVTYLISTSLSVADRRAHERELLQHYHDALVSRGVAGVPNMIELWDEHRRAAVWGVYIGWLTTPVANYGWEVTVANVLRVTTAMEDLRTVEALAALP